MIAAVKHYFSDFKDLKTVGKEFWLANAINFFDSLAYFSMINVLTLYLTSNVGFSDVSSGAWVGIFTLYITAFVFAVGSICDAIGIKRSFYTATGILIVARLGLGVAPLFFRGQPLQYVTMALILLMSLGTAFMIPVVTTSIRRYTTKETRSTGFNMYYLVMNVAAIFAGFAVTDGFRNWLGDIRGNLAILDFGFAMSVICALCTYWINEGNILDESERPDKSAQEKRPLQIFMEVWKESAFRKLILFLLLTIGVRLVFTHQFLVMPKYYTRVLFTDFDLGFANSINPTIIVLGLILLIPVFKRYSTFKLIVVGMTVSALSLLFMVVPIDWILALPWISNLTQAYMFAIFAQITVFAFGELIFSPRFTEYISIVAPKEKVASYMALSALPMFIAKPINGFVSGMLIAGFSYEGIRAKIDTGNVTYRESPEFMWLIYFALAALSPIAVIAMKRVLTSEEKKAVSGEKVAEEAAGELA